ncbi:MULTISPECIES: HAMP domain-containing sensor histidine kinase [unclassified Sphingomonas]|uniref:sensor histidine kinase n=1 Tax=unclassified Sphingomonas TaxID=196159 RepID=UPI000929BC1A|nr:MULTISPECIES: HAMP domain-containing sensor histidine kinase [unclassified Sphingomonas]OJU22454.1 MAG: histidine kinase [Sphingomonas sp. 66-10]
MLAEPLRFADIRRTSAFRLTAMLGATFAAGIVLLTGTIYLLTARELTDRSDRILADLAGRMLAVAPQALPARVQLETERAGSGLNYYGLLGSDGEPVAGMLRMPSSLRYDQPADIEDAGHGIGPIRLLAKRTDRGETLLVGRDITQIRDLRVRMLGILVWSGVAIAIGVGATAIGLSLGPLRRVRDLQAASRAIAEGHLERRMPLAGRNDELDQFADTVNAMVEDVGRTIAQVKGVTDAIAHDLRTPLTRVRANLHRIAQDDALAPDHRARLTQAVDDLDTVLERFAALLRISELEAGSRRAGFAAVDLGAIAASVADLYEPLAEDSGITLSLDCDPLPLHGDEKLLFEAVSNLVDNAIKFGRAGGHVRITTGGDAARWHLDVADDGPGIAADEREAVLRRFHRGSNAASAPGSGLGLSVVSAILGAHGLRLDLRDAQPGLIARITPAE